MNCKNFTTLNDFKFWRAFKLYLKSRKIKTQNEDNFCDYYYQIQNKIHSLGLSQCNPGVDYGCAYADATMAFLWRYRHLKHYFLDEGVTDFCIGAVKALSMDYAKALPVCKDVEKPNTKTRNYIMVKNNKIQSGFVLHFPLSEKKKSVFVIPDCCIPIDKYKMVQYYFAASDFEDVMLLNKNILLSELENFDQASIEKAKMIFGFSLYIDAFPETVVESKDGLRHPNYYSGEKSFVCRHKIIDDEIKASVSPHWRRGHFRLLSSLRFIHKCGMTIYVKGSFVKGEALDVLSDIPQFSTSDLP